MRWIALLLLLAVLLVAAACEEGEEAEPTVIPTVEVEATDTPAPPQPTDTPLPPEPTATLLPPEPTSTVAPTPAEEPLKLSEEDAGSTVELRVGDRMEVAVDGNPTTGFMWETAAVDASILKQFGEPEFVSESDVPGSGGTFIFRFEAVASGQTALQLIYHRPWETDVPPEKTFEVTVIVQ